MRRLTVISTLAALLLIGAGCSFVPSRAPAEQPKVMPYFTHLLDQTIANTNFRTVLFTGAKSQLVLMSIPPGGEIGAETHKHVEQTLFFVSGKGEAILDGATQAFSAGDVVVVTPGVLHNFRNTGSEPLKLYTVYAPPNHIDGRVHATKADADADTADEAFGEAVK